MADRGMDIHADLRRSYKHGQTGGGEKMHSWIHNMYIEILINKANEGVRGAVTVCVSGWDWRPGGPGFESCCGNFASELWRRH